MARTIVISDSHMPRHPRINSPEPLRELMDTCDRFVINGDAAELHQPGLETISRRLIDQLHNQAEALSTELLLLAGNHDPNVSPWRAAAFGSGRILITHGDAFHSTIAPWARDAKIIRQEWERIRDAHGHLSESIEDRFDAVRGGALAEWAQGHTETTYSTFLNLLFRPMAVVRILTYWRAAPRLARRFAESFFPDAQYLVVGHTHRPGINRSAQPVVINTGAFAFPFHPLAVVLEDDAIQVFPLVFENNRWRLAANRMLLNEPVSGASQLAGLWGPHAEANLDRGAMDSTLQMERAASATSSTAIPVDKPRPSQR